MTDTTIKDILTSVRGALDHAGIEDPARQARYILNAAGIDDATIIAHADRVIAPDQIERINAIAARRAAHEPLARILGVAEFYGLSFRLNDATLEPRPDTEVMVKGAIEWIDMQPTPVARLLDLGTGTGCIPISILKHAEAMQAIAVDLSADAVEMARQNARAHGVDGRLIVLQSNWAENVTGIFDLITSNPPYIPSRDIPELDTAVKNHDPILALDGGDDGFDAHRQILIAIKNHLAVTGLALIELGAGQLPEMRRLVEEYGLDVDRIYLDYGGVPRVLGVCHPQ